MRPQTASSRWRPEAEARTSRTSCEADVYGRHMPERYVFAERQGRVAVVRIDRPKMNALSVELLGQLADEVASLSSDLPGAVVVWGGERLFAAGADIEELRGPDGAKAVGSAFRTALDALASLPRATIAAVSGYALGGGCELALACDLRVADRRARFGQPEILLGVIPGGGATQRLARLIGPARAKDLIFTGRQVDAEEALSIGLVDRVVPAGQALDAATELASGLAAGPVVACGLAKRAVDEGLDLDLQAGLSLEQDLFVESLRTEDAAIGVQSFIDNGPGKARFVGR
jgi:enoyl-CoA hydratase